MRRDAMQQLYDWKEKTTRKPLIVRGARQVGKTWLMKEFASSAYRQFAYINFEDNEVMKDVFQKDFDVERILMAIQLVTGIVVDTETLIIFDEINQDFDMRRTGFYSGSFCVEFLYNCMISVTVVVALWYFLAKECVFSPLM